MMEGIINLPKISVIMLTYNREDMLSGMIECILGQTFKEFEYLIVDNGSTDSSGIIADQYAEKDKRIKVIHRDRGNIGSGRNVGLDTAIGEYIAFVDDDDLCTADYLEFLFNMVIKAEADAAICGAADKAYDEKKVMTPEEAISVLLWRKKYNVAFPAKLFSRKLFDKNRFLNTGKYDDIYLMPKILSDSSKVVYHGLPKYTFMRHGKNNSNWTQDHRLLDAGTLDEYLSVYRKRTEWLIDLYPDNADEWQYFEWSFMISMVEKVTRLQLKDCYNTRDRLMQVLSEDFESFINCEFIQDFEKAWMFRYIK